MNGIVAFGSSRRRLPVLPRWLPLVLLAIAAGAPASPSSAAPPVVTFEDQAVLVSGATASGSVAVFGVSQGFNGFTAYYLEETALLVDEDGDGSVRLELDLPLEKVRSVWAVVDLASGELALAAPKGEAPRAEELSGDALGAERDRLTVAVQRWAYTLWVRPGREAGAAGAWAAIVGDGGAADADGAEDKQVQATVKSFQPVAAGKESALPAPEQMAGGDLVLVVDPETLAISTLRVAAE